MSIWSVLKPYVRCAYPAVAVETVEEQRLLGELLAADKRRVYVVGAIGGLRHAELGPHGPILRDTDPTDSTHRRAWPNRPADIRSALTWIAQQDSTQKILLVVQDAQSQLQPVGMAPAIRAIKEALGPCKARGHMIVLVAPSWRFPAELSHDIPVIPFSLPTRPELRAAFDSVDYSWRRFCGDAYVSPTSEHAEKILDAAAGLTLQEAENAFTLGFDPTSSVYNVARIAEEKCKLIRQSGVLEVVPPVPADSIGGLGGLKRYLAEEVLPSQHDPMLAIRGILACGFPGCGKSLAAKAIGSLLDVPVIRMDIGSLKGSLVGQSEANTRAALALVDAVAPCVLWIDEIEKGVGGFASSAQSDGGTVLAMVGILLSWMQEHTSPVLVFATANDWSKLPPELTRAGRFDERFFVDLPSYNERDSIASIHLRRLGVSSDWAPLIAELTDAYSGAEIEDIVKSSVRRSRRNLSEPVIRAVIADARPLSRVDPDGVSRLRTWAHATLRPASEEPQETDLPFGRLVGGN